MTEAWKIVCATGHRPQHLAPAAKEWTIRKLDDAARWLRDERGTLVGISGMAIGVDQWWAEAVLKAGLILGAYVPSPQQPQRWHKADQDRWHRLLAAASKDYSRTFATAHSNKVLHKRNIGMLNSADAVVCVWDPRHRRGGTFSAVCAAAGMRKPGVYLNPFTQRVHNGIPSPAGLR